MKKFCLLITIFLLMSSAAWAQDSQVKAVKVYPSVDLKMPVQMTQPLRPHSTMKNVWWVVEQQGRIVRFHGNEKEPKSQVVMDIRKSVKSGGERGLLGLAFHPKFHDNGFAFVNYTYQKDDDLITRIARFESKDFGKTFDPESEVSVLEFEQPYGNHNGGHIAFGPDGRLYIGIGDGGAAGDPQDHSQRAETILGTIARINVDKLPYTVPADNPFVKGGGRSEIFAWGLRNPWKFSFDRKTGDLWAADVGQNAWEEVNIVELGKNYGWRVLEGTHCYNPKSDCDRKGMEPPVTEYPHSEGQSVTGGYVYRGSKIPGLQGHYIFGDFVSGKIWSFDPKTKERKVLMDSGKAISTFVEAADGELGFLDYTSGDIYTFAPK